MMQNYELVAFFDPSGFQLKLFYFTYGHIFHFIQKKIFLHVNHFNLNLNHFVASQMLMKSMYRVDIEYITFGMKYVKVITDL